MAEYEDLPAGARALLEEYGAHWQPSDVPGASGFYGWITFDQPLSSDEREGFAARWTDAWHWPQPLMGTHDVDHDNASDDRGPSMKDCRSTYQGFTVTCDACASGRVILEHTLGLLSSEGTGPWSQVRVRCISCGAQVEQDLP